MGDRGNVVVRSQGEDIWLYAHCGGHRIPELLQQALRRRVRWEDAPYLTRIVFCTLIEGDNCGETGFGISASCGDNEHYITVLDVDQKRVESYSLPEHVSSHSDDPVKSWSFDEYCGLEIPCTISPKQLALGKQAEEE